MHPPLAKLYIRTWYTGHRECTVYVIVFSEKSDCSKVCPVNEYCELFIGTIHLCQCINGYARSAGTPGICVGKLTENTEPPTAHCNNSENISMTTITCVLTMLCDSWRYQITWKTSSTYKIFKTLLKRHVYVNFRRSIINV